MTANQAHDEESSIPFYPDHVRTEFRVVLVILGIAGLIGVAALFSPIGLGDPADPMNTPAHVKPEWYFMSLYQLLKFIPKTAGVVLPIALLVGMIIWPFIDRKPDRSPDSLRKRFIVVSVGMFILIALTIWGEVS